MDKKGDQSKRYLKNELETRIESARLRKIAQAMSGDGLEGTVQGVVDILSCLRHNGVDALEQYDPGTNELLKNLQEEIIGLRKDRMTGLYPQAVFVEQLHDSLAQATRSGLDLCMLIVDIDHFKSFNDDFSYVQGNQVIIDVAETLRNTVRTSDYVFRYGGEEFGIIAPATTLPGGIKLGEKIRAKVKELDAPRDITVSVGVAGYTVEKVKSHEIADTLTPFIECVSDQVHHAKQRGRDRVCGQQYFPDIPSGEPYLEDKIIKLDDYRSEQ